MVRNITLLVILFFTSDCLAQYHPVEHRKISKYEIPVTRSGSYSDSGKTYLLVNDISDEKSTVFLGKDVTLDLNGYTIRYADARYEHVPNSGFEEGLKEWDVSQAPGAKVMNTADVHVFLGNKLLSLETGDEITSQYIKLPVAGRSYFAMCGITGRYWHDMKKYPDDEMRVSVYVEDENGDDIKCLTKYGEVTKLGCPAENKSPRLGGGFVYAHLSNLPAGKYRIRIKANNNCLVDEIDIRPAMDAGISIIDNTTPLADYDHVIMESYPPVIPAFFDYTDKNSINKPLSTLPEVKGKGTITIKNGIIESGVVGILSWGIQSSASDVKIILENVNIKSSGISSGAADISWASISNCRFDVDMPFLIQRHVGICSVILRGVQPSTVANSEFNGGQGCLSIKGKYSLVHDNHFINNQTVTNHYSIMGTGDSSKIYNNRFEPKQGSGIYVSRYTEVFDNIFRIETSPPTCEYGREEYSTAAIRLGDYHAEPGSPKASVGNQIHNNKIFITAKNYPEPKEYIPMSWGIFYSASGGENYVFGNEIVVNKTDSSSKVITAALYICGGPKYFGGQFFNNRITTNVSAAWIASVYGGASNSRIYSNTIIPLRDSKFKTFKIGYMGCDDCIARNVEFRSNEVVGNKFDLDVTSQKHSYSVYWTYLLHLTDEKGEPVKNELVTISDRNDSIAAQQTTDKDGLFRAELMEYSVNDNRKIMKSPYTVRIGNITEKFFLNQNTQSSMVYKSRGK
jgi:hypothetical protein